MPRTEIIWRLAQLASLPYQERYVIGGTAEEYVLDTELIENVDAIRFQLNGNAALSLTEAQSSALTDLLHYIETHSEEALADVSCEKQAERIRSGEQVVVKAGLVSGIEGEIIHEFMGLGLADLISYLADCRSFKAYFSQAG